MGEHQKIVLNIAGMRLAFETDRQGDRFRADRAVEQFLCDGSPDLRVRLVSTALPSLFPSVDSLVFEVPERWGLYRIEEQNLLVQRNSTSHVLADRLMVFDRDFTEGEVFVRGPSGAGLSVLMPNPLEYPLGQVLMVCLLARGRGVMVHACAIDDHGQGYLFAGNSGHGKSTMARLWQGSGRVLNDDRVVVREHEGRFWVYATPWHGDFDEVCADGVPLAGIFCLRAGSEHRVRSLDGLQASTKLLTRLFPPLWDRHGMEFTLDFLARLTSAVPCHDLQFALDGSVVDFVRCLR